MLTIETPSKYVAENCPCCGQTRRTINGRYLRHRRELAGLDQRTLAKRMGISGPYLSDLERNRRECPRLILQVYDKLPRRRRT